MSNKKITDLPILTTTADDDVLPIVDVSADVTKQIYIQDLATRFSEGLQPTLVSGTNIKTLEGQSLLGSGNIDLVKGDVGLGNVDNTSDANKPVSTATQTALDAKQDTLVSGTNIKTINSTSLLGSGDIVISANPSGVSGAIQFSDGSAFASDASNLFWDDTNNKLGIGTNAPDKKLTIETPDGQVLKLKDNTSNFIDITVSNRPQIQWKGSTSSIYLSGRGNGLFLGSAPSDAIASLQIRGSGTTSATTALLVQNSAGVASLQVLDDTSVFNYGKGAITTNTAFGSSALINNTTGSSNTAIGVEALRNNTTGNQNTAIGESALSSNTTGGSNTAIGNFTLSSNTTASSNTAVGRDSLRNNTTGSSNTAIGTLALRFNTTGTSNTANGGSALQNNTTGSFNTANGFQALRNNTASNNTALGYQAGFNITTGAGNVCIGSGAEPLNATDSNQFVVGSASVNAGAVTTEVIVPDTTWTVRINGANYKIAMLAI